MSAPRISFVNRAPHEYDLVVLGDNDGHCGHPKGIQSDRSVCAVYVGAEFVSMKGHVVIIPSSRLIGVIRWKQNVGDDSLV